MIKIQFSPERTSKVSAMDMTWLCQSHLSTHPTLFTYNYQISQHQKSYSIKIHKTFHMGCSFPHGHIQLGRAAPVQWASCKSRWPQTASLVSRFSPPEKRWLDFQYLNCRFYLICGCYFPSEIRDVKKWHFFKCNLKPPTSIVLLMLPFARLEFLWEVYVSSVIQRCVRWKKNWQMPSWRLNSLPRNRLKHSSQSLFWRCWSSHRNPSDSGDGFWSRAAAVVGNFAELPVGWEASWTWRLFFNRWL